MEVVNLCAGPLQVSVMKEELQPAQRLLPAATCERNDLRGTKKPVPMNVANDVAITLCELDCGNLSSPLEAGKADGLHACILPRLHPTIEFFFHNGARSGESFAREGNELLAPAPASFERCQSLRSEWRLALAVFEQSHNHFVAVEVNKLLCPKIFSELFLQHFGVGVADAE